MTHPALPPLPQTGFYINPSAFKVVFGAEQPMFTEAQMRAYGQSCYEAGVAAERERCAKVCEENSWRSDGGNIVLQPHRGPLTHDGQRYAAAIRKG